MSAIPMPFVNAEGDTEYIDFTPDYKPIELSRDQQTGVDLCIKAAKEGGQFIFITGKAGTGKSTILRIVRSKVITIVVAPTGLAAINVDGETIHRFFGFGTGPKRRGNCRALGERAAEIIQKIVQRGGILAIDEISMVRADLLDAINWTLQKTLGNDLPFGGISIVAFGDMWQLEPVVGDSDAEAEMFGKGNKPGQYKSPFWFDAKCLSLQPQENLLGPSETVKVHIHNLNEVFRQKGDDEFIDALNDIRVGKDAGLAMINTRRVDPPKDCKAIKITFTNKTAESTNQAELDKIAGESTVYTAKVTGDFKESDYPVPLEIPLKVGARVMVAKNVTAEDGYGLVNGDMGEVIALDEYGPTIYTDSGRTVRLERAEWKMKQHAINVDTDQITEEEVGCFTQYPLKHAWAITTHKSQGQTLDGAILTLDRRAFAHGQLYVALSRVRTRAGLYLMRKLIKADIRIHPRILEMFGESEQLTHVDTSAFGS